MQQSFPSISIILTVENALPNLDRCLDSIVSQSTADWELICIDNGSTDGSSERLDKVSSFEPRMTVTHCARKHTGSAINLGLQKARGEYVAFLSAEDYCVSTMFEEALAKAREHHADMVIFGGRYYDDQTDELSSQLQLVNTKAINKEVFSPLDHAHDLFTIIYPGIRAKLFRRGFLEEHQLRLQPLPNTYDLSFTLAAASFSETIAAFDGDLLRCRAERSLDSEDSLNSHPLCFIDALLDLKGKLEEANRFSPLSDAFNARVLASTRHHLDITAAIEARQSILDSVASPMYGNLDLLFHDEEWYPTTYAFECARYLEAALRQQKTLRIESERPAAPTNYTCVVQRRTNGTPLISAVVPVFNTGHLICATLDSIRNQQIDNIEIICVDDGSTDNSLEIITTYAESDPRLSVYHQDNRGPGAARNVGQHVAQGKYLSFVDSDDILAEQAYSTCLDHIEHDNLDMIIFDAEPFYDNPKLKAEHPNFLSYYTRNHEYAQPRSGAHMLHAMVEGDDYKPATWLYLVQRQLLDNNNIYTHPGIIHEDNGFTFRILCHANRVAHIHRPLYRRRIRESSIMTTPKSFANVYGYYMSSLDMAKDACSTNLTQNAEIASSALQLIFRAQHNARKCYSDIPEYEMGALKALPSPAAKALTTAMDASNIGRRAKSIINNHALRERKAQMAAQRIANSRAYRIGECIIKPLRSFKKVATMRNRKN